MFVYLSKKIAIPRGTILRSLAWNREQGWIACGGDTALLKVLKLEASNSNNRGPAARGVAAPSALSMNQTLEGHNEAVVCVAWNSQYRKLTTSDKKGLIIVWMLHKGTWFEEMINNRNKSVVTDMQWSSNGEKICIAYKDGAVIVGSVDGNRLWGKELGVTLQLLCWSPDSQRILFVSDNQVLLYDHNGNKLGKMALTVKRAKDKTAIVGIDW